eukprot:CAMPEP_0113523740 /NCGR_PEP_ID=MMETSP0014_2-20120614/45858_1 /TAXON_ID=2857 /ORGANISM="Nitzschia sp." /LENGTH=352 /DNA_ID=CAMNT_0000421833 /DNA_START=118 /DNA_END=1173 /DNA_ORIENTATION=+ /assembly_acc=CAM_ASM_000159
MSGLGGGNGASASCTKCVKVLRELISGLQDDNNQNHSEQPQHQQRRRKNGTTGGSVAGPPLLSALFSSTSSSNTTNDEEPPPLTLLKAIAEPPTMMQKQDGRSGSSQSQPSPPPKLEVEEVEDGVRLTIPVEATLPHLLRRWTKIVPLLNQSSDKQTTTGTGNEEDEDDILKSPHYLASNALATSAKPASDSSSSSSTTTSIPDPLTIELKCRKCASTGPEGGARAFLMGPQPLSVVLCHNRIDSEPEEINEILTHELTHLYDVQTLQLDLQECENLAYSEVRAAKSAECRNWSSSWKPYCAKQKAMNATHNLYPKEARSCVNKVFETAFNDNRPFHQQRDGEQSSSSKKQF